MGEVLAFRDPNAPLQGDELEAALAVAHSYAEEAARLALSRGLVALGRVLGCERLGVDELLPIYTAAMRRELQRVR